MNTSEVILVPIKEVHILNPRARNQAIAEDIRHNIKNVGLKRPITVTLSTDSRAGKKYDLVCGQGRLEAFIDAGEEEIPAIIIEADKENAHIMSLVENIARRNNNSLELLHGIRYLRGQGYDDAEIAEKTGLGRDWIRGIIKLLEKGEERLVNAVEKGRMPLYIALKIATEDETAVQIALTEAHETGKLVGGKLIAVQKLLDRRNYYGKKLSPQTKTKKGISIDDLNSLYTNDIKRKKRLMAKAEHLKQVLAYTIAALNKLLRDEHFSNQLKAEGMNEIPQQLTNLLKEVR